jgi:dTDP-4-dehydrorhamnose reductase
LLVHYSTDYVYDGSKAAPYVESDATVTAERLWPEQAGWRGGDSGVGGKSIIFRTSWVFGARGGNFVKTILRLAREKKRLMWSVTRLARRRRRR